ncbi:MAG: sigma-54-dependent Fis family transcriptional regulator [Deltaproteobacteria bacterium]|nr:sigma-54-dependent Fis family transcriptional regulator [Deltaproteobacteria bacterium]
MRPRVLVVDDDAGVRYTLREILEDGDMEVAEAESGEQALAWLEANTAHLVICDLAMPGIDGMGLLERIRAGSDSPEVIMITAHGSERHAVEAMKLGAYDYFAKPFDIDAVMRVIERAVQWVRLDQECEALRAELHLARHMVFASDAMRKLALMVHRVAPRDVTVMITGPSGTGKELLAEAIVDGSTRRDRPFVRFNCAAVPGELAEAELFGHSRGAFTGATTARPGLFREADSGTILLDEVGELGAGLQAKLLRVLQQGALRPVGEAQEREVDVRVLAATNRDLEQEVAAGRFREDLLYRLDVVRMHIPPLAERIDDVEPLCDHFLRKYAERFGTGPIQLTKEIRSKILTAAYPGNVRELEHRIERMVALSSGGHIDELGLGEPVQGAAPEGLSLKSRVAAFERGLIANELARCGQNRSEAARRLGVSRVTLLDKMKKYDLR